MVTYTYGVWDILREEDLDELDKLIQITREESEDDKELIFGVGIYEEEVCTSLGMNRPLKSVEDRMRIMEQIIGVDFTFPVHSLNKTSMQESAMEAYKKYKEKSQEIKEKEYKLGYAPGTYDLFHVGHLENLLIASESCEKLIVGVKSDELVLEHKGRKSIISDEERMAILSHFKFVDGIYKYHTRDLKNARKWIEAKYKMPLDVVYFGSDLREDFADISDDIKIIFTPREEEMMKIRSTSAYRKRLMKIPSFTPNEGNENESVEQNPKSSNNGRYTGNIMEKILSLASSKDGNEKKDRNEKDKKGIQEGEELE